MSIESTKTVEFRRYKCKVIRKTYSENGRPALLLQEEGTGEHIITATANLPNEECGPNQAYIKNYSENLGVFGVLVDAGIVRPTGVSASSGYCVFPLVDIL